MHKLDSWSRIANVVTAVCAIIISVAIMVSWNEINSTVEAINQSFTELGDMFVP